MKYKILWFSLSKQLNYFEIFFYKSRLYYSVKNCGMMYLYCKMKNVFLLYVQYIENASFF